MFGFGENFCVRLRKHLFRDPRSYRGCLRLNRRFVIHAIGARARTGPIVTVLLTACTVNFVLTLLMIIKRMYYLLDKELERNNPLRKSA